MVYMDLHVISIAVILEIVIGEVNQGMRKEYNLEEGPDEN